MEWTDIRLTVAKADADNAEAVATMIAEGGIYIEDYSDIEQQVAEIAHVDLIEQDLLDQPRDIVKVHMYLAPDENPAEILPLFKERLEASRVEYKLETSGIEKTADGAAAGGKSIDIESLVSMNMWALTPEFVDLLDAGFVEFFEKAAPANPLKAEYLLPIYIDELLHADKVSVKVLPTHDKWFGVTYAEDKQTVIDSFAKLVADGVYRKDLFSDLKK